MVGDAVRSSGGAWNLAATRDASLIQMRAGSRVSSNRLDSRCRGSSPRPPGPASGTPRGQTSRDRSLPAHRDLNPTAVSGILNTAPWHELSERFDMATARDNVASLVPSAPLALAGTRIERAL